MLESLPITFFRVRCQLLDCFVDLDLGPLPLFAKVLYPFYQISTRPGRIGQTQQHLGISKQNLVFRVNAQPCSFLTAAISSEALWESADRLCVVQAPHALRVPHAVPAGRPLRAAIVLLGGNSIDWVTFWALFGPFLARLN